MHMNDRKVAGGARGKAAAAAAAGKGGGGVRSRSLSRERKKPGELSRINGQRNSARYVGCYR